MSRRPRSMEAAAWEGYEKIEAARRAGASIARQVGTILRRAGLTPSRPGSCYRVASRGYAAHGDLDYATREPLARIGWRTGNAYPSKTDEESMIAHVVGIISSDPRFVVAVEHGCVIVRRARLRPTPDATTTGT